MAPQTVRYRTVRILAALAFATALNTSAAAGPIDFVYALQQAPGGANQIHGLRFDRITGSLTLLPGFPIASGGIGVDEIGPELLAYGDGRLYVLNDGDNTMTVFSVNRITGALTALPFSPIALGIGNWQCVSVHPSGSPVVVGNAVDDGAVTSFAITATTATPAAGSPFGTGSAALAYSCGFSRDGATFYAGGEDGSSIAVFTVNPMTSVLTALAGSPFNSGGSSPRAFATDSSGRLFSVTSFNAVRAYTIAKSVLMGAFGNPFASGLIEGEDGVVHPGGYYMVADKNGDSVFSYVIAGTGLNTSLKAVGEFSTGGERPNGLALTPDGAHLLAANSHTRNITVFQVNQGSGTLTSLGVQAPDTLGSADRLEGLALAEGVPPFSDDPLAVTATLVKAVHISELRTHIHALRVLHGLGPFAYVDPVLTPAASVVRTAHVSDLRAALAEVYIALAMAPPSYTDPGLAIGSTVVKGVHITELRAAVIAIE